MSGIEIRRIMANTWTTQEVANRYGRWLNAVHQWIRRKHDPLPVVRVHGVEHDLYRFLPDEVCAWAKRNGKTEVKVEPLGAKRK